MEAKRKQAKAEAFAVGIDAQGAGDAVLGTAMEDEVERLQAGDAVARDGLGEVGGKKCGDTRDCELVNEQRIVLGAVGDDGDVDETAFVSGACVGDLAQDHGTSSRVTVVRTQSLGMSPGTMAMLWRTEEVTPQPPAGPLR